MPSGSPTISVVMPVYNALPHLDGAIRSILDQTHRSFEFLIYDDASTDGSAERLRHWAKQDERIRLFEGDRNLGPVGSSAFVVEHSTGEFVARMDADDSCSRVRVARELEVFRRKPGAGLVGTLFEIIDENGRRIRGPDFWRLGRKSAIAPFAAHGSIMFRRKIFDAVGGYRPECEYWEDQDLVARISTAAEVWVIPEPLYQVRQWARPGEASSNERVENAVDLMYRCVARRERKESYEDLLEGSRVQQPARVDPRVFIAAGSKQLWSGAKPRLFGRLLKRGRLGLNAQTLTALIWTAWACASPSSLRAFLSMLLRFKNAKAKNIAAGHEPLRWSPATISND